MKRNHNLHRAAALLAAILCLTAAAGCSTRSDTPDAPDAPSSTPASEAEASASETSAPLPEATPTAKPEPAPAVAEPVEPSDISRQALAADARMFIDGLGPQEFSAATQLKSVEILTACLTSLYLQRELNAYIFEEDGAQLLIPSALLGDAAAQRFGLDGFLYPASERFVQDKDAYRYDPKSALPFTGAYEMGDLQGNEDSTLSCTAQFINDPGAPSYIFTFRLMSLNGAPYLQIVGAHLISGIDSGAN